MATWVTVRQLKGLAFDIENKPGTYGPGDYTHPKVTAIGCKFLDENQPFAWCFKRTDPDRVAAESEQFRILWDKADYVVGHNIRRHDKRILDGHFTSYGLPLLADKRMVDTYCDQPRMEGLSRSLENLAGRWESPIQKIHLTEYDWEQAYDGIPEKVALMRRRVISDVEISIWLHDTLIERGLLQRRSL